MEKHYCTQKSRLLSTVMLTCEQVEGRPAILATVDVKMCACQAQTHLVRATHASKDWRDELTCYVNRLGPNETYLQAIA
jgi:hypothetical protein